MKVEVNGCSDEQQPDKKKVSGLVHVLYKVTIQREFANFLHLSRTHSIENTF